MVEIMSTLCNHGILERVAADEASKGDVVVLVRRAGFEVIVGFFEGPFVRGVELPAGQVVASVVQELARVAETTPAGF